MLAGVRGVEHAQALEVFIIAQAAQRRVGSQCIAMLGQGTLGHAAGEKTGADAVDVDVVLAPFRPERAGEIDHRAFGGVVGDGADFGRVAPQTGDRGNVDDAATAPGDHALFGDGLAQQKIAADIEVHHLVPGLDRMVLGRRPPGGAGVVDQDVDIAHTLQGLIGQPMDLGVAGAVGSHPARVNASSLQLGAGLFQVRRFARTDHDPGTRLAQRMGHLQPKPAGAARDQGRLAGEVKQLLNGARHGVVPGWVRDFAGVCRSAMSRPRYCQACGGRG